MDIYMDKRVRKRKQKEKQQIMHKLTMCVLSVKG